MLLGHLGAALAAKAVAPRVGLGTLVAASFLLDIVLWLLVIPHVEGATVPGDFAASHGLVFDFPWSHSLTGAIFWSLGAAFVWTWSGGEGKYFAFAPAVIAATALSHWLLDFIVHQAELPLWGPGAPMVGLGLGRPGGLTLEFVIAAAGLGLYWRRSRTHASGKWAIAGLVLLLAGLSVASVVATVPPSDIQALAVTMLLALLFTITVAALADRERA